MRNFEITSLGDCADANLRRAGTPTKCARDRWRQAAFICSEWTSLGWHVTRDPDTRYHIRLGNPKNHGNILINGFPQTFRIFQSLLGNLASTPRVAFQPR